MYLLSNMAILGIHVSFRGLNDQSHGISDWEGKVQLQDWFNQDGAPRIELQMEWHGGPPYMAENTWITGVVSLL